MALEARAERQKRMQSRPQRPAWPTLKRAIALHRPHTKMVTALIGVIVFTSVVGLGPPVIIQKIIDSAILGNKDGRELNLLVLAMLALVA
ncbi:MAG: hypothetical protein WBO97_03875, partial [Tepidiformaceae bacterium]